MSISTFISNFNRAHDTTHLPIAAIGNTRKLIICMKIHHKSFFWSCTANAESSVCSPGGGDAKVNTIERRAGTIIRIRLNNATLMNNIAKLKKLAQNVQVR